MKITTTKTAARNGHGNVVAKGLGKQKTTRWDHSKSSDWNHGNAAGALILHMNHMTPRTRTMYATGAVSIAHDSNESGTVHTFIL
jgi:hypothetical protein